MSYDITRSGTRLVLLPSVTSDSGRAGFYRTEHANAGCSVSVAFMPNLRACSGRGPDTVSSAPSGELLVQKYASTEVKVRAPLRMVRLYSSHRVMRDVHRL